MGRLYRRAPSGATLAAVARRASSWTFVGPAAVALVALFEIAVRQSPPAFGVANGCLRAAALLLGAKLLVWIAVSGGGFGRGERLAVLVAFCAIGMGWYAANQWMHERQFDYLVAVQNEQLKQTVTSLSANILAFLVARARHAPPPPRPASWEQDEAAFDRYEAQTVLQYDARFGRQVRAAHDVLGLLGITDPDFETFYAHPANAFQLQVVARRLALLADRVHV